MTTQLIAQERSNYGRCASRRLRRSGMVPAVIYGLNKDALSISLEHNMIYHSLKRENFHTSILTLAISGKTEKVLLRDFQLHAYRPEVLHLDFQRVDDKEEIQIKVPLHFINEEISKAVKLQSAHITHVVTEVEIRALAKDIPHSIEIDLANISAGQSIHLSNLLLPHGVVLVNLLRGDDAVVAIAAGIAEEKEAVVEVAAASDIPTVGDDKAKDNADS